MTQEQIIGNKAIAEFMGGKWQTIGKRWLINNAFIYELAYHSSWDWLLPVIEKISNIEFDRDEQELPLGGTEILIHTHYPRTFGMLNNTTRKPMFRFNCAPLFEADTLIEAAWLAVTDFIKTKNNESSAL